MAKVSITELPIHIWTPMTEGKPCIARIGNLPMIFHGATPMKARNAADQWRIEEVEKERAREAAKEKRLKAAAEAREARKAKKEAAA